MQEGKKSNRLISIVIPAKNEESTIAGLVRDLKSLSGLHEIIVIDDGSDDCTADNARSAGAVVKSHPISLGNGAAIKSGARLASGEVLVFMDADGQHSASDVRTLIDTMEQGYDLVVGSRASKKQHSSTARWWANSFYNRFASLLTGSKIEDLTSGFRAVNREKFLSILHLLPNKFSYPTTSTIAFLRLGYGVAFAGINVEPGLAGSHISPIKDGFRFAVIIFKIVLLFSPFKALFPLALAQLFTGLLIYLPGLLEGSPVFTNGMALLLTGGIFTLAVAIISEQLTLLLYK